MEDNLDIRQINQNDPDFPKSLKEIPSSPESIYIRGNFSSPEKAIAIVGTRKSSPEGEKVAGTMAFELAKRGMVIVSGLAFGIDSAAHQGALEAGGTTWAVLGGGIDKVYPTSNKNLADKIIQGSGCLISEYPPGTESLAYQFILRNRLISGISQAVVVIEAPQKSGALATARFAFKQKRKVMAVPGSCSSFRFAGSNQLIREGAILVRNAADVLEELGEKEDAQEKIKLVDLNENQKKIFEIVEEKEGLDVDNIGQLTKLSPQEVGAQLMELVMKEIIEETGTGKYIISQKLKV